MIDDFRVDVKGQVNRLEGGAKADLRRKHASLLAFDYEAAARLKAWDSLDQIIKVWPVNDHIWDYRKQLNSPSRSPKSLKIQKFTVSLQTLRFLQKDQATASSSRSCPSPTKLTPRTVIIAMLQVISFQFDVYLSILTPMQQIINMTWQLSDGGTEKLSRWIRCLFSLALSDIDIAMQLLDQALTIAEDARKVCDSKFLIRSSDDLTQILWPRLQQSKSYPPEELEWLATTAFNRAIDFYCTSEDVLCRLWAGKALALSNLCEDGGALHEVLQQKYQGLSWHA